MIQIMNRICFALDNRADQGSIHDALINEGFDEGQAYLLYQAALIIYRDRMVPYRLWIDDDSGKPGIAAFRNPPDDTFRPLMFGKVSQDTAPSIHWIVAHNSAEAIWLIDTLGPPTYISFDHDLGLLPDGQGDTAMIVIQYLTDNHYDTSIDYDVHSQNPIGKQNIISKMESWKRSRSL